MDKGRMLVVAFRIRQVFWAGGLVVAVGCSRSDPIHRERGIDIDTTVAVIDPASATAAESNGAGPAASAGSNSDLLESQVNIQSAIDSIDRALRRVRSLTLSEKLRLRRDVNAVQIERARSLGIQPGSPVEQLAANGKLVKLADANPYWVVRNLKYSLPYVTPSTEAMLAEIGQRFQARLDSLGVPRYRLDITSVLRTPDKQAALRRANSNASRVESAHEFGTTVDLAYRRFAPPVVGDDHSNANGAYDPGREWVDSLLVETGEKRSGELQAVLGRVLQDMQTEGKLLVRMERRQTVYHITVGRAFPRRTSSG